MKVKSKAAKTKTPQVKVQDMKPKKDAKAGGIIVYDRKSGGDPKP